MFSTTVCCHQGCQYIYEQFIIRTVFQTAGHMYVKVVIITCQEKFPAAHSLEKIQASVAAFSNFTRCLYLVTTTPAAKPTESPQLTGFIVPPPCKFAPYCEDLGLQICIYVHRVIAVLPGMCSMESTRSPAYILKICLNHIHARKIHPTTKSLLQRTFLASRDYNVGRAWMVVLGKS